MQPIVSNIKKELKSITTKFLFEPLAESRTAIKEEADTYLSSLLNKGTIFDFLTVADASLSDDTPITAAVRIEENEPFVMIPVVVSTT